MTLVAAMAACGTTKIDYVPRPIELVAAQQNIERLVMTQHQAFRPDDFVFTDDFFLGGRLERCRAELLAEAPHTALWSGVAQKGFASSRIESTTAKLRRYASILGDGKGDSGGWSR